MNSTEKQLLSELNNGIKNIKSAKNPDDEAQKVVKRLNRIDDLNLDFCNLRDDILESMNGEGFMQVMDKTDFIANGANEQDKKNMNENGGEYFTNPTYDGCTPEPLTGADEIVQLKEQRAWLID